MVCPNCSHEMEYNVCKNCGYTLMVERMWSSLTEDEKKILVSTFLVNYKNPSFFDCINTFNKYKKQIVKAGIIFIILFILVFSIFTDFVLAFLILIIYLLIFYIRFFSSIFKSVCNLIPSKKKKSKEFLIYLNDNNIVFDSNEDVLFILQKYNIKND